MKVGDPKCISQIRSNSYRIKALENFSYHIVGAEKGIGVREKSKSICELLDHPDQLEEERAKAKQIRSKLTGMSTGSTAYPLGEFL